MTKQTPGRPVTLPIASAIMAAPPSCRHTVTVTIAIVKGVEHGQIALSRHAEYVANPVDDQLVDQCFGGGPQVVFRRHE